MVRSDEVRKGEEKESKRVAGREGDDAEMIEEKEGGQTKGGVKNVCEYDRACCITYRI